MRKLGTRGSYRLREPDKFKGHLEFALKLKWLDIESIQQSVHGVVICAPMTAFWATTKDLLAAGCVHHVRFNLVCPCLLCGVHRVNTDRSELIMN